MRVATFEFDVRVRDVAGNLDQVLRAVEVAAASQADLLTLPEMWPTSFAADVDDDLLQASEDAVRAVASAAGEHGLAVIGSAYHRGQPLPTNRAHVLSDGGMVAHHDKVHLFTPTAEHLAFRAGEQPPAAVDVATRGGSVRLAPIVCYDLRFPDVARAAFRDGAEMLVVVAQWPESRVLHWDALVRGRAAELLGYVVANNRVGVDLVGRRKMELTFPGRSFVAGPAGDVQPSRSETIPREGCADGRLSLFELDLRAMRALRRAVPIERDERSDLFRRWWDGGV